MVGIGALASAGISSLFKIGAAIKQAKRAKQAGRDAKAMEAKGWNKYNTPEAFREKEAFLRSQYNDPKMMGQRVMEDKLGANTANRISSIKRTAGSGAEAMLGLGLAQNNMNRGMQDIGLNATAQRMSDFNNFLNALQQKSGYQDKEWEINKFNPYQQKLAEKQALEHSSRANAQNFASDLGNMGIIGSMMKGGQFGQKDGTTGHSGTYPQNFWNMQQQYANYFPNAYTQAIDPNQADTPPILRDMINQGKVKLD